MGTFSHGLGCGDFGVDIVDRLIVVVEGSLVDELLDGIETVLEVDAEADTEVAELVEVDIWTEVVLLVARLDDTEV